MSHGGARPGAGRPRGSSTFNQTKTREIIEKAAEEGILPLQVMFDNIRFYRKEANELIAKLIGAGAPAVGGDKLNENPHASIIDQIGQAVELRKAAGDEAARAAQYCHPRQGYAGDEGGQGDDEVPLADRLKEYQRRDDLKAAGANIVDLNKKR